ncbi:MAG TPA: hypothetical protein PLU54_10430, partial [Deltaproteobacteria bacterium]|nr:hypothetical protein [Deltaproteobacteria bacterium]
MKVGYIFGFCSFHIPPHYNYLRVTTLEKIKGVFAQMDVITEIKEHPSDVNLSAKEQSDSHSEGQSRRAFGGANRRCNYISVL